LVQPFALQGEFNALRDQLMRAYPDRAALFFSYDEPLSHLIFAASDMFLVPSMFEPCGLTQVRLGVGNAYLQLAELQIVWHQHLQPVA
jgi:hypothetical protein